MFWRLATLLPLSLVISFAGHAQDGFRISRGPDLGEIEARPNLEEIEADVAVLLAIDEAIGALGTDRRGLYTKQLLDRVRKRKEGCTELFEALLPQHGKLLSVLKVRSERRFVVALKKWRRIVDAEDFEDKKGTYRRVDRRVYRLAWLMKVKNLTTIEELDNALTRLGSSTSQQRRAFTEEALSQVRFQIDNPRRALRFRERGVGEKVGDDRKIAPRERQPRKLSSTSKFRLIPVEDVEGKAPQSRQSRQAK